MPRNYPLKIHKYKNPYHKWKPISSHIQTCVVVSACIWETDMQLTQNTKYQAAKQRLGYNVVHKHREQATMSKFSYT